MADLACSPTPVSASAARPTPAHLMLALAAAASQRRRDGDMAQAQRLIERALEIALLQPAMDAACALWCEQAELLTDWIDHIPPGSPGAREQRAWLRDQARGCCLEALVLARRASDPQWEVQLLLRASDALDHLGEHADAIAVQCHAMRRMAHEDETTEPRPAALLLM
jgi:hypothetical protein